jgi:divalent metal cation (Fe/Co/Zn/Cd) transporter
MPRIGDTAGPHALCTRQSTSRRFVSVRVLVPGAWAVHQEHQLRERLETDIARAIPGASVLTHLESLEDSASWDDQALDRGSGRAR